MANIGGGGELRSETGMVRISREKDNRDKKLSKELIQNREKVEVDIFDILVPRFQKTKFELFSLRYIKP